MPIREMSAPLHSRYRHVACLRRRQMRSYLVQSRLLKMQRPKSTERQFKAILCFGNKPLRPEKGYGTMDCFTQLFKNDI